ncbi:MAG: methylmalonyl-CoA epimerase [Thermomicrobiales bacterium]
MTDIPGSPELHHVGIVVGNLDEAIAQYALLGLAHPERLVLESQGIEAAVYEAGQGYVELISPTDPEGPIARFLEKRGNTVHHVAFRVDDLEGTLRELAERGTRLIDTSPRPGAHGWRIAFIHPESCSGVLVELVDDSASGQ